jgi:hypothetical protein
MKIITQHAPWTAERQAAHTRLCRAGDAFSATHRAYHRNRASSAAYAAAHREVLAAREAMSAADQAAQRMLKTFVATTYTYADGRKAPGRYVLVNAATRRGAGGALVAGGKAYAYAGMPGDGGSVELIKKYADKWVEADDLQSALAAIKPHLLDD